MCVRVCARVLYCGLTEKDVGNVGCAGHIWGQRGQAEIAAATSFASSSPPIWWRSVLLTRITLRPCLPGRLAPTAARLREPCGEFRHMWQRRRRAGECVWQQHLGVRRRGARWRRRRCAAMRCVHRPTLRSPRHPSVTGPAGVRVAGLHVPILARPTLPRCRSPARAQCAMRTCLAELPRPPLPRAQVRCASRRRREGQRRGRRSVRPVDAFGVGKSMPTQAAVVHRRMADEDRG